MFCRAGNKYIPEIENLKAQLPFPREDFSFPTSGGLLTADAGTAQVKNELKNYTTTNKGRWFLLFRTRMASVLFEKVCKKVV